MMIESVCCSHTGKVRQNNEDNFLFCGKIRSMFSLESYIELYSPHLTEQCLLLGVFDGMGGLAFGEKASYIVAQYFASLSPETEFKNETWFLDHFLSANAEVLKMVSEVGRDSGSTAALMLFEKDRITTSNIGDSRVYRFQNHELNQLSEDHTDRDLLDSLGVKDRQPSLLRYLGMSEQGWVKPTTQSYELEKGDIYLCCSDGLFSMLSNAEISEILDKKCSLKRKARKLVECALKNGGEDNVTLILCRVKSLKRRLSLGKNSSSSVLSHAKEAIL